MEASLFGSIGLAVVIHRDYIFFVSTLTEVQRAALELSDDERALLMARLWESLADSNVEGDIVEQRLKELANDPASEISHDEFIAEVQKARSSGR